MNSKQFTILFRLIQWAAVCVFLGRAYQHWFWDAPFRSLLWDETWMSGLVETFSSLSWTEYSTSPAVDKTIQNMIKGFGVLYFVAGLAAIFAEKIPKWLHWIWMIGTGGLLLLAALYCKEKFFSMGQFLEYSLQVAAPVLLFMSLRKTTNWTNETQIHQWLSGQKLQLFLKILIALTFTCHGLYALGYYPVPGNFMDMTINILGVSNEGATTFLKVAGILDFIIAFLIFIPIPKIQIAALMYAVFWGFSTSIARVWAHFYKEFPSESLHQWLHETLYRFPHFLIPLLLLLLIKWRKQSTEP